MEGMEKVTVWMKSAHDADKVLHVGNMEVHERLAKSENMVARQILSTLVDGKVVSIIVAVEDGARALTAGERAAIVEDVGTLAQWAGDQAARRLRHQERELVGAAIEKLLT